MPAYWLGSSEWSTSTERGGWDGYVLRYTAPPPVRKPENRARVAADLEALTAALRPLHRADIVAELLRAAAVTVPRPDATEDHEMWLAAMSEALAPWPADIVVHVLRSHAEASRWRPVIADLMPTIRRYAHPRRALADALATMLETGETADA